MSEAIKPKTYAAFLSNPQEAYKARTIALYQHNAEEILKPRIYALYDASNENNVSISVDISRKICTDEVINADVSRTTTSSAPTNRYTNMGQSGGAIVGRTVNVTDTDKQYSNTGAAVYNQNNMAKQVSITDLGFTTDVSDFWIRFDYYTVYSIGYISVYFDEQTGGCFKGLDGTSFCGTNISSSLTTGKINKIVIHMSPTTCQLYINDSLIVDKSGLKNGTKITGVSMASNSTNNKVDKNNNMFSNIIMADYDCSQETLADSSKSIEETINADIFRITSTDEIVNTDIFRKTNIDELVDYDIIRTIKDNTIAETINADIVRKTNIDELANYDITRILKDNTIAETINADITRKVNINEIVDYDVARTIQDSILYINQGDGTSLGLTSDCNYTGKIYNPINETAFSTKSKEITIPLSKNKKQLYISYGVRLINNNNYDCIRVYINNSQNQTVGIKFDDTYYYIFINNNNVISGELPALDYHQVYMALDLESKTAKYYIDNVLIYNGTNVTFSATDLAADGLYIKTDADDTISNIIVSTKELTPDTCLINNTVSKIYQPVLTSAPSKSDDFYAETNCECTDSNSETVPSTDVWKYINHSTEQGKIKLINGSYVKFKLAKKAVVYGAYFNHFSSSNDDEINLQLMYSDDDINYKAAGTWETQQDNSKIKTKALFSSEKKYHKYWQVVFSGTNIVSGTTTIEASATVRNIELLMTTEPMPVLISTDTHRYVIDGNTALVLTDIKKITTVDVNTGIDLNYQIVYNADFCADIQRLTSNYYTMTEDIVRNIVYNANIKADTKRIKHIATVDNADTRISIPSVITDQSSGLQSVSIGMGQSQLSDSIRIVTINPVDINGAVIGNFLDYKLNMRAETTSQKGILQEITCMTDKDEILYKKIVYTGDADAKIYHGKEIYNEDVVKNQSEILSYMKLSKHMNKIANVLGCNLVMCSDDYISTCSLNDSGATYQSIISELCGWTSKLPNMFINAFIRGNTLYIIQRGHEPNEINIDNLKMTEPTIAKKLVRTEWNNAQSTSGGGTSSGTAGAHFPDDEKDDGDGSDVDPQEPRVETSSDTRYADDGGYTVTETTRNYEEIGALHGAVMISRETEKCTAYSAENPASTTIEDGVEVYRGASRDITVTLTETNHLYDSHGWHTVETTTTVDGVLKETHSSKSLGSTEGVTSFRVHAARDSKKDSTTINSGDDVNNYNSLVDSDFPVWGDYLQTCKDDIKWLNRKVQETVTLSIYDYTHIFDFCDKIVYKGNTYSIQSNSFEKNATIVNKQDLVLIRFY